MTSNLAITVKSASPNKASENRIVNTKYTLFTFAFMMVKMQFESASSVFFFGIIMVQLDPKYRVTSLYSSLLPWLVIFLINVLREAIDNYFRYLRDKEINMALYKKFKGGEFVNVESQNIKVGDIILIEKGQRVPADCLLLKSEEVSGEIFIRTDQLDGETDWKRRNSLSETQQCALKSLTDIEAQIEPPSKDIYSFNGRLVFNNFIEGKDENYAVFGKPGSSPIKIIKTIDLEENKVVLGSSDTQDNPDNVLDHAAAPEHLSFKREVGCDLENTIWANTVASSSAALGLVIYTGHDTRSMMNTNRPRSKSGIIETELDRFVLIMAFLSLLLSIVFSLMRAKFEFKESWLIICLRFIIIFSYVIPISLKFMLTTARFIYVWLLKKDPNLHTVKVMTNTLQEELARISFFLTDKTGTLTKNEMLMRKLHIGTVCYSADNNEEIAKSVQKVLDKRSSMKKLFWRKSKSIDSKVFELLEALSVCHNVNPIESEEGLTYQASSPDEIAMVNYAGEIGLKLVKRDNHKIVIKDIRGVEIEYKILYTFPFNSDTKRMGIILQKDDEYIFFEKGADTVMKSIIKENDWVEEETDNMAREGLRTLVIAKKTISRSEFEVFAKAYDKAKTSLVDRNELMLAEQQGLEKDLDVIGLTGVEDKLQDKVKQTLESLRNAGIKIWMLTGDKIETAISIAFSSRLLTKIDQFMVIAKCTTKEEIEKHLINLSTRGYNSLVIDGISLAIIIEHFLPRFIDIAKNLHCLVGCRYSPTQKAIMALSLRKHAHETVLCIGDGGNDVSMITSADVGVGIEGKEGSQASLAADFSLKNFSDIAELMFFHGRRCYKNSSKMAHIIFHRGIIISTLQGIFCALIHFFPISILQGKMPALFIIFTIFPLFWIIADQDIPKSVSMKYPELFKELRDNNLLSVRQFFITLTVSVFQASAFILLLYFKNGCIEMFSMSIICFTNLIINEQLMVVLSVWENLNYRVILICLGSVSLYIVATRFVEELKTSKEVLETGIFLLVMNAVAIAPKLIMTMYSIYINPASHIKLQKQR